MPLIKKQYRGTNRTGDEVSSGKPTQTSSGRLSSSEFCHFLEQMSELGVSDLI